MTMRILIVGGGASGFFSAIQNKYRHPNAQVILLEQGQRVLSKVKISGGGRCNVTHACFDPAELCTHYPRGAKELRGPFHTFQPRDTMRWFQKHGVPLKVESDNRVFPVSDQSQSIIDCLVKTATQLGVLIRTNCGVKSIEKPKSFKLTLSTGETLSSEKLILATGSHPKAYAFAAQFGHTIVDPCPSLFTFKVSDSHLHSLSGLSVADTDAWFEGQQKKRMSGPVLVTHWGLSGPAIIKLSAWFAKELFKSHYKATLYVNWLPNIDSEWLIEFSRAHPQRFVIKTSPFPEIPQRLWSYLAQKAGVLDHQKWQTLPKHTINGLIQFLQATPFEISGKGVFKEEFVTCGGVSLKEIDFKTMESKCCPDLHIVGELLDIDGITGGFNFQNAWTTGYLSANWQDKDSP